MRLVEMLDTLGSPVSRQMREIPHLLSYAKAFTFGEQYRITFTNSVSIDIRDLNTMLAVIYGEFMAATNYDLRLGYFKNRLIVAPKVELGQVWNRNVVRDCGRIQDWVTAYNLSGEWPEEVRTLAWPRRE